MAAVRREKEVSLDAERWLTLQTAALRISVSVKKIRRLIASGELPAYTCGKRGLRVKPEDVDALMRPVPCARW